METLYLQSDFIFEPPSQGPHAYYLEPLPGYLVSSDLGQKTGRGQRAALFLSVPLIYFQLLGTMLYIIIEVNNRGHHSHLQGAFSGPYPVFAQ